jgi:hypothetical protein
LSFPTRATSKCCFKGSTDVLDGVIDLTPLEAESASLRINKRSSTKALPSRAELD